MHKAVSPVLATNSISKRHSPIHLVIGYEDFVTGQRAMKSCQRVIDNLSHQFQFQTVLWKFDVLRVPKLMKIAAEDMAEADLIVISVHGPGELPNEVKSWIEAFPSKDGGGAKALVALLDVIAGHHPEAATVHSYLQEFAHKANLDFFAHECAPAEAKFQFAHDDHPESARCRSSVLHSPSEGRDWGINE